MNDKETLEKASEKRGSILDGVAWIEEILNHFISTHFFREFNEEFVSTILEHPYFSLEMRTQILGKILKDHYPEAKFAFSDWKELQGIRNLAAHAPKKVEIELGDDGKSKVVSIFFPHNGKVKDVDTVHSRYLILKNNVIESLKTLPGIFTLEKEPEELTQDDLNTPGLVNRSWKKDR